MKEWIPPVLILIALVAAGAQTTSGASSLAQEAPLYFALDPGEVRGSLSALPPVAEEPIPMVPSSDPPQIRWKFTLYAAPENWTVQEGALMRTTLFFDGLENVIPADDPLRLTPPGQHRVEASLFAGGGSTSDQALNARLQPKDAAIARGHTFIDSTLIDGDSSPTVTVDAPMRADQEILWNDTLTLQIVLTGVMQADLHPVMHLGSSEAPASVVIPGFPVEALRIQEKVLLQEQVCNQRILRGEECELPVGGEEETVEASGPAFVPLLGAAAAAVGAVARTRRRRAPSV